MTLFLSSLSRMPQRAVTCSNGSSDNNTVIWINLPRRFLFCSEIMFLPKCLGTMVTGDNETQARVFQNCLLGSP
jgi:hypothetical protein